jgi:hypothetical protein
MIFQDLAASRPLSCPLIAFLFCNVCLARGRAWLGTLDGCLIERRALVIAFRSEPLPAFREALSAAAQCCFDLLRSAARGIAKPRSEMQLAL